MRLCKWEELPKQMQTEAVRKYYDILAKKRASLLFKRLFDFTAALLMLIVLSPLFLIISIAIKIDSSGPVFYRQERITQYGRIFRIHKFRTMVQNADKIGTLVTLNNDYRVTRIGRYLRRCRLDEIPQLLDLIQGTMSFVGMRAEVPKYVEQYTPEMMATLLLPAGITSEACIRYKDEAQLLDNADDIDKTYVENVLPGKMFYCLREMEQFSFFRDIITMVRTVLSVFGREYIDARQEAELVSKKEDEEGSKT